MKDVLQERAGKVSSLDAHIGKAGSFVRSAQRKEGWNLLENVMSLMQISTPELNCRDTPHSQNRKMRPGKDQSYLATHI